MLPPLRGSAEIFHNGHYAHRDERKALLSWYLANFANYDATYGSLGAAIGMMIWMWMSSIVILLGAELNSEVEHQTVRDSTTGHERPLGERGAAMADTVGRSS
jgi:membrane protein